MLCGGKAMGKSVVYSDLENGKKPLDLSKMIPRAKHQWVAPKCAAQSIARKR